MTRDDYLLFLAAVQIDLKRQIMTLDTLAHEDDLRYGPLLMSLPPEAREAEIRRRHGERRQHRVESPEDVLRLAEVRG